MSCSPGDEELDDEVQFMLNGFHSITKLIRTTQEFIVDIDGIQAHGVGAADIIKLKTNGYYTVTSVHAATRKTLLKIKGFSEVKVEKVKEAVAKCLPSVSGFITAAELGHQRKRVVRISTGSKQLDAILGGYDLLL
ncbi:Meiotic recombination protein dmc1 [Xylographa opegraphella]|nr:Meiotic recombination protein dmc1 [Xylographa opegraphella]